MNVFFVVDNEVITPALLGSILPGITRKSVIELLKSWGYKVTERRITAQELVEAYKAGKFTEMFGSGTAAVISPIGLLSYKGKEIIINNNEVGALEQRLYDTIYGIQTGTADDPHGWGMTIG